MSALPNLTSKMLDKPTLNDDTSDLYNDGWKYKEKDLNVSSIHIVKSKLSADEELQKINIPNVKVGTKLTHQLFCEGIVVNIGDGLMTVSFGSAEKTFQFPDAILNGSFI